MVTLDPTSALSSVDLPAFGAPMSAINPHRVSAPAAVCLAIHFFRAHALTRQRRRSRGLLGRALGPPEALDRLTIRKHDGDAELQIMMRAGARDLAIIRCRQAP